MVDIREQRQLENDDICSKFIGLHVTDAIAFAYMLNTPVSFADNKGIRLKRLHLMARLWLSLVQEGKV